MTSRRHLVPALLAFALLGLASPAYAAIWYRDMDGDGYGNSSVWVEAATQPAGYVAVGGDCNDGNPAIHPGRIEVCNGIDDDCDALIDENVKTTFFRDADGDGYGNPAVTTQACSRPAGYSTNATDCNDANPSIYPGAPEICNGVDDDCDTLIDENVQTTFFRDADGDSYGDPAVTTQACSAPAGYVTNGSDCNDANPSINPGAPEICNGIDDDCDTLIDENGQITFFRDADGDGYGDPAVATQACSRPYGFVANASDCNDETVAINPGAPEICNGVDDDCDTLIDENGQTTFFRDADGDTYGDPAVTTQACSPPPGFVANASDCNDANPSINPGANEECNGIDDDCDTLIDENGQFWYPDRDADGYGDPVTPTISCSAPPGHISQGADCNDGNPAIHPGATEVCNGVDDDCDGVVDGRSVCTPYQILSVTDVGNDQGRRVRVRWNPEANDGPGSQVTITSYSLYRRVQKGLAPGTVDATPPGEWDYVQSVPASGETSYSVVVPTLCDSTAGGICWSTFFVRAHTPAPLTFFDTTPAAGYSIDNLAPGVPQALLVNYAPAGNTLAWEGDAEPDLSHWRVYRGTDPAFIPSPATLVHSTASPGWSDGATGGTWHYKVTAVDFAGNEGPAASPQATTPAVGVAAASYRLHAAAPNPSRGPSLLSFDVPAPGGDVALRVFDPSGRQVATLARGFHAAGTHRLQWSGRDGGSRELPSGTYYLRLQTPVGTFAQRVTLVR